MHNIYFARHGETVWNVENKICGMTDSPLTEKGRQQARELGRKVRESGVRIDEILYSPLSRAADTAKAVAEATGMPASCETICGNSASAATRARPGTARSSASPRPTSPTATATARA